MYGALNSLVSRIDGTSAVLEDYGDLKREEF